MPTYDYWCEFCDLVFEVQQSIHDEPLGQHEDCGGTLVKIISSPMVNLRQGKSNVIHTDTNGSHITQHWDGRQDAHVVAKTIEQKPQVKNPE